MPLNVIVFVIFVVGLGKLSANYLYIGENLKCTFDISANVYDWLYIAMYIGVGIHWGVHFNVHLMYNVMCISNVPCNVH